MCSMYPPTPSTIQLLGMTLDSLLPVRQHSCQHSTLPQDVRKIGKYQHAVKFCLLIFPADRHIFEFSGPSKQARAWMQLHSAVVPFFMYNSLYASSCRQLTPLLDQYLHESHYKGHVLLQQHADVRHVPFEAAQQRPPANSGRLTTST